MINSHPTKCNLCGGRVVFISNARVYGREYGSGKCYYCMQCGAFVGTHEPRPTEARGILADRKMRYAKKRVHDVFDAYWKDAKHRNRQRSAMYEWLAKQMNIKAEDCHIGFFTCEQLEQAFKILISVRYKKMKIDRKGNVSFE